MSVPFPPDAGFQVLGCRKEEAVKGRKGGMGKWSLLLLYHFFYKYFFSFTSTVDG